MKILTQEEWDHIPKRLKEEVDGKLYYLKYSKRKPAPKLIQVMIETSEDLKNRLKNIM